MSQHGNPVKATRYTELLESARCNGDWESVPELARKVAKHAPLRKCLVAAAREEAKQASLSQERKLDGLQNRLSELTTSLSGPDQDEEDRFQARTAMAVLQKSTGAATALANLPPIADVASWLGTGEKPTFQSLRAWTRVCLVKCAYTRLQSEQELGHSAKVERAQKDSLELISLLSPQEKAMPQMRLWLSKLVAQSCLTVNADTNSSLQLQSLRTWISLDSSGPTASDSFTVWKLYYRKLTEILHEECNKYWSSPASYDSTALKELVRELQQVETRYEKILMARSTFPHANEHSTEVHLWVDMLMSNWSVITALNLSHGDDELMEITRNVQAMLFRAATKTHHSTAILRHLFTIHASLSEFLLAGKAITSYVDIVMKTRLREEKSRKLDESVDDEDTFLSALSTSICALCEFGGPKEAERATQLADLVHKRLVLSFPGLLEEGITADREAESLQRVVSSSTYSQACRAIGLAQGNWSRVTYNVEERTRLQSSAVTWLERVLSANTSLSTHQDHETLFALSRVYAERRDVDNAIAILKSILTNEVAVADTKTALFDNSKHSVASPHLWRFWHFLALCLGAKQEYQAALVACETSLESMPYTLQHYRYKQEAMELRILHLEIISVLDGAEAAVNQSPQLLIHFTQLFGQSVPKKDPVQRPRTTATIMTERTGRKTIRDSLFPKSRPSTSVQAELASVANGTQSSLPEGSSELQSGIQRSLSKKSTKLQKRNSLRSLQNSHSLTGDDALPTEKDLNAPHAAVPTIVLPTTLLAQDQAIPEGQPLPGTAITSYNNTSIAHVPRRGATEQSSQANGDGPRLPNTYEFSTSRVLRPMFPIFSQTLASRATTSCLVSIWLFLAKLYISAEVLLEAKEAVDEAMKLAAQVETAILSTSPKVESLAKRGWFDIKSSERLSADVFAVEGQCHVAAGQPHDAIASFEKALVRDPTHVDATIGLSTLLLDMWDEKIPVIPKPQETIYPRFDFAEVVLDAPLMKTTRTIAPVSDARRPSTTQMVGPKSSASSQHQARDKAELATDPQPDLLDRLAARDRAYGLLSALTKLGLAWDHTEAWWALSRAYEASQEIDKARDVLWWIVDLEEKGIGGGERWGTLGGWGFKWGQDMHA